MSPSVYNVFKVPHHHSFPGSKKSASSYGPATAAPNGTASATSAAAAPKPADDDDVDLFGSDDEEEDAEAERIKQERLAEYHAKKSASTYLEFIFICWTLMCMEMDL